MRTPRLLILAAALALAGPRLAAADTGPDSGWSLTLGVWGGASRYDVLGLKHGVETLDRDTLDGNLDTYGASALLRLGWLDVGALYEGSFREATDSFVLTPLVGFKWDVTDLVRVDFLGELGGHRITNIGTDAQSVWLPYVGVRPTLSLRLPLGPTRLVLSGAPFARWDLVKKDVAVPSSGGATTTRSTYEAGGTTFGVVGGVGIEL
ncbi:hypothetical protein [Anaeromyxobacter sp. SG26]|uniref:hypothetical protein n=1 Tax=Anaeromyxobacter sp. SG26 TaxID=2925407 RepID=UPI001F5668CE|nr:hypothetical protein [Anaeromyxobacter sp. SG26]